MKRRTRREQKAERAMCRAIEAMAVDAHIYGMGMLDWSGDKLKFRRIPPEEIRFWLDRMKK